MNLIPIDTGGTPTELVGGDASPGGDFAALMTGLMSGDTQIVPLIDIPSGEHPPDGRDVATAVQTDDVDTSILGFVGTPPAGMRISPTLAEPTSPAPVGSELNVDSPDASESPIASGPIEDPIAPDDATPSLDSSDRELVENGEPAPGTDPRELPELATVHPIRSHVAHTPEVSTGGDTLRVGAGTAEPPLRRLDGFAHAATDAGPVTATAPSDRPSAPPTASPSIEAARPTLAPQALTVAVTNDQAVTDPGGPQAPTDVTRRDTPSIEPDMDIDTSTAARPLEPARSGSSITQPAMVGIARRVEEAIAALATKPDPKIVTLQLDELDGLRLTVALRPDGIHLSSSGDTTLTTEIERALASRGFDMASGSDRGRQGSGENTDDGWRPQPAPTGRHPRPNQPGIRL